MTAAAPHLYQSLRGFCLAGFAALGPDAGRDGEIPFVLDDHNGLYEYRPLLRDHVESRVARLTGLVDARLALDELRREPAAAVFARGARRRAGGQERTLFRAILLPLLVSTAEACGGFDWEDGAFNRVYGELERSLFGPSRAVRRHRAARRPPAASRSSRHGIASWRAADPRGGADLADAVAGRGRLARVRARAPGGRAEPPRRARGARRRDHGAPAGHGRRRSPPGRSSSSGSTGIRSGSRPMLGIAATRAARASRRGSTPWRGKLAGDAARSGSPGSEEDAELGEALERWELSLFEAEPLRSERLREALAALLGGGDGLWAAAMRAAVLVGEIAARRPELVAACARWPRRAGADAETADTCAGELRRDVLADDRAAAARAPSTRRCSGCARARPATSRRARPRD